MQRASSVCTFNDLFDISVAMGGFVLMRRLQMTRKVGEDHTQPGKMDQMTVDEANIEITNCKRYANTAWAVIK